MQKKLIWILILSSSLLTAQGKNPDPHAEWKNQGISVIREESRGSMKTLILKDAKSFEFQVTYSESLSKDSIALSLSLKNRLQEMQSLSIKSLELIFSEKKLSVILVPLKFQHQEINLLPFFPAGLFFFYEFDKKTLAYDLKFFKQDRLYSITGEYQSEGPLLEQIMVYFKEKEPETFFARQKELQQQQFQQEQIRKEAEEKLREELKEELKKEIIKEIQEKTPAFEYQYQSSDFFHALKVYAGTGTLLGIGYSFGWGGFQIMPYSGLILYQDQADKKKIAAPAGLKLSYSFFRSRFFEPYVFLGGAYNLSIQNYESRYVAYSGLGEIIFNYLFIELSYMISKNQSEFALGLGFHIPF